MLWCVELSSLKTCDEDKETTNWKYRDLFKLILTRALVFLKACTQSALDATFANTANTDSVDSRPPPEWQGAVQSTSTAQAPSTNLCINSPRPGCKLHCALTLYHNTKILWRSTDKCTIHNRSTCHGTASIIANAKNNQNINAYLVSAPVHSAHALLPAPTAAHWARPSSQCVRPLPHCETFGSLLRLSACTVHSRCTISDVSALKALTMTDE